jgi:uncharacterized protein YndB with AHSA1/START domain
MPVSSGSAVVTLPTDEQILITREFDAPRHLVFKAYTTPELVSRWWPGQRGQMQSAEIDLRVGGSWRYVMSCSGDLEVAFHGEFREIVPGQRLVTTEIYEGVPEPDEPAVNVVTFTEIPDDRTLLEVLVLCPSKEMRDAIIDSGMEGGMQEGMDLLEQITVELR